jgi:predicted ester cyclase
VERRLDYHTQIIAEDFVAHAVPLTGSGAGEIHGRDALNAWVSGIHSVLPDLAFTVEVGPITDKDCLVVRWRARGTYGGGFPGASTSAVSRKVTFTGTDTLRIVDSKIAEYWANADSLLFVQQLGLSEVPGSTSKHYNRSATDAGCIDVAIGSAAVVSCACLVAIDLQAQAGASLP